MFGCHGSHNCLYRGAGGEVVPMTNRRTTANYFDCVTDLYRKSGEKQLFFEPFVFGSGYTMRVLLDVCM